MPSYQFTWCIAFLLAFHVSLAVVTSEQQKAVEDHSSLSASTTPWKPGSLVFEQTVWNKLMTIMSPPISDSFRALQFPQTSSGCTPYALYAGQWIDSVAFASNNLIAASGKALQVTYPINITGLSKEFAWTSFKNAVVNVGNQFSICFQICAGSAPYSSTTSYETDVAFNGLGSGAQLQATVTSTTVDITDIKLQDVQYSCVASQAQLQSAFDSAMASVLPQADSTTNPTIANAYNSLFQHSSPLGYQTMSVNSTSRATMFDNGAAASQLTYAYSAINAINPDMRSVTPTSATSVAGTTEERCVTLPSPCIAPVAGISLTTTLETCVACLQSVDNVVYVTAGATASLTPKSGLATAHRSGERKPHRGVASKHRAPRHSPAHAVTDYQFNTAQPTATNSEMYASIAFIDKLLATTSNTVTSLINNISIPSQNGVSLPQSGEMCTTTFSAFEWTNLDTLLPVVLSITNSTTTPGAAAVQIGLPLNGLLGKATFSVSCGIALPIGPAASSAASGTYTVQMNGTNSDFRLTLDVTSNAISVSSPFPIVPSIAYAYTDVDEHFLFDSFVENYFQSTLAQEIADRVKLTLTTNVSNIFMNRILEVTDAFTSLSTTLSEDVLNVSLLLRSGSQILPLLDDIVPKLSVPHPTEDGGTLSVIAVEPPPFNPSFCSNVIFDTCSADGILQHPIPSTAILHNCTMCVKQYNNQVILGVRYVTDFVNLGSRAYTPTKGVPQRSPVQSRHALHKQPKHRKQQMLTSVRQHADVSSVAASPLNLSSAFYIGVQTLTQATYLANTQTQFIISNYSHAPATSLGLPYLSQCGITHEALHFQNNPNTVDLQVTKITVRENPNHNGSATDSNSLRVQVAFNNLPQHLFTQVSPFSMDCGVNVDLPMNFTTSTNGNINVSLVFAESIPLVEFELLVANGSFAVHAVSTNMTPFVMSTTYTYAADTQPFVFDPYGQHYAHTTLLDDMANEYYAVLVETAGDVIASAMTSFLSQITTDCPLRAVNDSHVIATTGASCGSELPLEPLAPTALGPNTMWYVLNAGPLPVGIPTNTGHSPLDFLNNCTNVFPLAAFQSDDQLSVQFVNCSTYGEPFNGNLIVGTYGELPLQL